MSNPTLGFIGAGTIARTHMASARALGFDRLAVADPSRSAVEAAATDFGIQRCYADYRELLADPRIDAVVIATPNMLHAEQAVAALDAGKHVLLEKPMAPDTASAERIVAATRRAGRRLQMGMANRFKAGPQALRAHVRSGACGRIYAAEAAWYRRRGIPGFGGWATTQALAGGGALLDIGVHMLDLALHLMDFPQPVAVSGATWNVWRRLEDYHYTSMWGAAVPGGTKDVEDYAIGHIRFAEGQILQLNAAWAINLAATPHEQKIRVMGEQGGAELRGLEQPYFYGETAGRCTDTTVALGRQDEFQLQLAEFAASIREGRDPLADAQQGLAVTRLLEAIYRSAESGREVRFT